MTANVGSLLNPCSFLSFSFVNIYFDKTDQTSQTIIGCAFQHLKTNSNTVSLVEFPSYGKLKSISLPRKSLWEILTIPIG